ncbi:MAG: hypothetical protein ACREBW_04465, partial [Candidatus Micrarchaeaceae archaeon]
MQWGTLSLEANLYPRTTLSKLGDFVLSGAWSSTDVVIASLNGGMDLGNPGTYDRTAGSIRFTTTPQGGCALCDQQRMFISPFGVVGIGLDNDPQDDPGNPASSEKLMIHAHAFSANSPTPFAAIRLSQDWNSLPSSTDVYRHLTIGLMAQNGDWGPGNAKDVILDENSGDFVFYCEANPADPWGTYQPVKTGDYLFYTRPTWGTGTSPLLDLVVKSSGNVGIGTAAPAQQLDVEGTFPAGSVQFSGMLMPGGSSGNEGDVLVSHNTNSGPTWESPSSIVASAGWGLSGNAGTNSATNFAGTTDAQDFVLKANHTEQLRITE